MTPKSEGWLRWKCPKCGDPYKSPIPIKGRSHPCPADYNRTTAYQPVKEGKP